MLDLRSRFRDAELLVAERGGRVVGTITLYRDASQEGRGWPDAWSGIRAVAVEPSARGLGIGRRLTEVCIERSRAAGARAVCLHTASFMAAAVAMYESVGFGRAPEFDWVAADLSGSLRSCRRSSPSATGSSSRAKTSRDASCRALS